MKKTQAKILTYAGTLPFIGLVKMSVIAPDLGLDYNQIILAYGAVIVSFIAGIHWGLYLLKDGPVNLFIHSNIVALLAWVSVAGLIPSAPYMLLACFLYLLLLDKQLYQAEIIEKWYLSMRIGATAIVFLTLGFYILIGQI